MARAYVFMKISEYPRDPDEMQKYSFSPGFPDEYWQSLNRYTAQGTS